MNLFQAFDDYRLSKIYQWTMTGLKTVTFKNSSASQFKSHFDIQNAYIKPAKKFALSYEAPNVMHASSLKQSITNFLPIHPQTSMEWIHLHILQYFWKMPLGFPIVRSIHTTISYIQSFPDNNVTPIHVQPGYWHDHIRPRYFSLISFQVIWLFILGRIIIAFWSFGVAVWELRYEIYSMLNKLRLHIQPIHYKYTILWFK